MVAEDLHAIAPGGVQDAYGVAFRGRTYIVWLSCRRQHHRRSRSSPLRNLLNFESNLVLQIANERNSYLAYLNIENGSASTKDTLLQFFFFSDVPRTSDSPAHLPPSHTPPTHTSHHPAHLYSNNVSRNVALYNPDQIQKMEESMHIHREFKPLELIKWVKALEGELSSETVAVELSQHLKQNMFFFFVGIFEGGA
ncbi:hypothetical protein DEO72_LG11g505 [Vigna unguiculata]|uniref:Uncharacterized protein n=1 Tax=Vigna unguiculata TaxID=3917 RepID=A0A4D6NKD7_VIGUN|nr:hypothetical protein DEO72_LG11g505 [Vigna unguiculata]